MEAMKLSHRSIQRLKEKAIKSLMNRIEMDKLLEELFPLRHKHVSNRQIILEASAITAYQPGYDLLDERIDKTRLKKESLLWVLRYPELPLHNNCSELGARAQARYRDISFHTMSQQGAEMKDALMTIVQTAKKLSVNTYEYLYDRITKLYRLPPLARLIQERSQQNAITVPIFNTT